MLILLALVDANHQITSFSKVAKSAPRMAFEANLMAFDPNSYLVTGDDMRRLIVEECTGHRLREPRITDLDDITRGERLAKTRYGRSRNTYVVLGGEELYKAFLPFADEVVLLRHASEGNYPLFDGTLGVFPNLSDKRYHKAWDLKSMDMTDDPNVVKVRYLSAGRPHFELEAPPGVLGPINEEVAALKAECDPA